MNEMISLGAALLAGILLGSLFFGGLWWTTRKGLTSEQPALWFVGSLLARMGLMLAGLYFVSGGDWHRTVCCLTGFIIARMTVLHLSSLPRFEADVELAAHSATPSASINHNAGQA
jgi:F1F0 ATPase subunit 2